MLLGVISEKVSLGMAVVVNVLLRLPAPRREEIADGVRSSCLRLVVSCMRINR